MKQTMNPAIEDLADGISAMVNLPTVAIGFVSYMDAMVPMVCGHQSLEQIGRSSHANHHRAGQDRRAQCSEPFHAVESHTAMNLSIHFTRINRSLRAALF